MKILLLVVALLISLSIPDAAAQVKSTPGVSVSEYKNGLAIVTDATTGKKGLINEKQEIVAKAEYDYIEYLGHGYYKIIKVGKNKQKIGVVADGGKIHIKPQYEAAWLAKKPTGKYKVIMTSTGQLKMGRLSGIGQFSFWK